MNWPAGMGGTFEGLYDLVDPALMLPDKADPSRLYAGERVPVAGLDHPPLATRLSADSLALPREETHLPSAFSAPFHSPAFRHRSLSPVFLLFVLPRTSFT